MCGRYGTVCIAGFAYLYQVRTIAALYAGDRRIISSLALLLCVFDMCYRCLLVCASGCLLEKDFGEEARTPNMVLCVYIPYPVL